MRTNQPDRITFFAWASRVSKMDGAKVAVNNGDKIISLEDGDFSVKSAFFGDLICKGASLKTSLGIFKNPNPFVENLKRRHFVQDSPKSTDLEDFLFWLAGMHKSDLGAVRIFVDNGSRLVLLEDHAFTVWDAFSGGVLHFGKSWGETLKFVWGKETSQLEGV